MLWFLFGCFVGVVIGFVLAGFCAIAKDKPRDPLSDLRPYSNLDQPKRRPF